MEDLEESRSLLNQEFVVNISFAFSGIRKSILIGIDAKSKSRIFDKLRNIVQEDEVRECGHENLMRKLSSNNSEELKAWLYTYLNAPILTNLREAITASKDIRESDKKLVKLLTKCNKLNRKSSKKTKKSQVPTLSEYLTFEGLHKSAIRKHTALLACLQEQLDKNKTLGLKAQRRVCKLIEKTMKLMRRLYRSGSNVYSSESSSSSDDDIQEPTKPQELEPKRRSKKVTTMTKISKALVQKITKSGIFKVHPWPLGDPEGAGIQPRGQVNYGMFLVSTWMIENPNTTPSVDSLVGRPNALNPSSSILTVHSISSSGEDEGAGNISSKNDQEAPKTVNLGSKQSRGKIPKSKNLAQEVLLSEKTNVYLRAVKKYKANDKTELNLKIGQIVKQKRSADARGYAYGWTKSTPLSFKKYGFYPVSHLVLDGEERK